MKRCFIVFYHAHDGSKQTIGNVWISTVNGNYINYDYTVQQISDQIKMDFERIVLTNIIELPEKDFIEFANTEK